MRLRIPRDEVVRILMEWHARLGVAIPALAARLEDGPAAFEEGWAEYNRTSLAEVALELDAAADDAPRAL